MKERRALNILILCDVRVRLGGGEGGKGGGGTNSAR